MRGDVNILVEKLREVLGSWTSIEIQVRTDMDHRDVSSSDTDLFNQIDTKYFETALGCRMHDQILTTGSGKKFRMSNHCDGQKSARVFYIDGETTKQRRIEITKHFAFENEVGNTARPAPLLYLYVEKVPLPDILHKATALGSAQVLQRDCDTFLFPSRKSSALTQDLVYYIDRETGWPLRVEFFDVGSGRSKNELNAEWEAKSFDRVQGNRFMPLRSELRGYARNPEGSRLLFIAKDTVESIRFDQTIESAVFQMPKAEPGVTVANYLTNSTIKIAGPDPLESTRVEVKPRSTDVPFRWTSYVAPTIAGLGIALVLVAVIVRRKRS